MSVAQILYTTTRSIHPSKPAVFPALISITASCTSSFVICESFNLFNTCSPCYLTSATIFIFTMYQNVQPISLLQQPSHSTFNHHLLGLSLFSSTYSLPHTLCLIPKHSIILLEIFIQSPSPSPICTHFAQFFFISQTILHPSFITPVFPAITCLPAHSILHFFSTPHYTHTHTHTHFFYT